MVLFSFCSSDKGVCLKCVCRVEEVAQDWCGCSVWRSAPASAPLSFSPSTCSLCTSYCCCAWEVTYETPSPHPTTHTHTHTHRTWKWQTKPKPSPPYHTFRSNLLNKRDDVLNTSDALFYTLQEMCPKLLTKVCRFAERLLLRIHKMFVSFCKGIQLNCVGNFTIWCRVVANSDFHVPLHSDGKESINT